MFYLSVTEHFSHAYNLSVDKNSRCCGYSALCEYSDVGYMENFSVGTYLCRRFFYVTVEFLAGFTAGAQHLYCDFAVDLSDFTTVISAIG